MHSRPEHGKTVRAGTRKNHAWSGSHRRKATRPDRPTHEARDRRYVQTVERCQLTEARVCPQESRPWGEKPFTQVPAPARWASRRAWSPASLHPFSMKARVIIVGSFIQDLAFYTKNFPQPGESVIGDFRSGPGGKGFNQAVAATRAGATAQFI